MSLLCRLFGHHWGLARGPLGNPGRTYIDGTKIRYCWRCGEREVKP